MATTSATTRPVKMLPYKRMGEIDYGSLEFDPDEGDKPEDHMEQWREIHEVGSLFASLFTEFWARPDVFIGGDHFICPDPSNLNVRVAPDLLVALGVDDAAIRSRRIYLPWEAGKVPDWVLEIASETTSQRDVVDKRRIYAEIGIPEYFTFDPSGGEYHGMALWGGALVNGVYEDLPLTAEPDGIPKVYSPTLGISMCNDDGWPRLWLPETGEYVLNWAQEREEWQRELEAERDAHDDARTELEAERDARAADQIEIELLRERIRQLESED